MSDDNQLVEVLPATVEVVISNCQAKTTSLAIAKAFGKNHFDVLKSIRNLECSEEFTASNFAVSEYLDPTGRKLPMYEITRDGAVFLIMGYTGKEAARFKEAYIAAFNRMESELQVIRNEGMKQGIEYARQILENVKPARRASVDNPRQAQLKGSESDPWDNIIAMYAEDRNFVTVEDIMSTVFEIPKEQHTRKHQMRISRILKRMGWKSDIISIARKTQRCYVKKSLDLERDADKLLNWMVNPMNLIESAATAMMYSSEGNVIFEVRQLQRYSPFRIRKDEMLELLQHIETNHRAGRLFLKNRNVYAFEFFRNSTTNQVNNIYRIK